MKILISLFSLISLAGCAEMVGTPYQSPYNSTPYYYGDSYNNRYDYNDRSSHYNRKERERLERERIELERERTRLERERLERERRNEQRNRAPETMSCPSGFAPSSSKCSDKERRSKRGCRDMRLPNGQLCVDR